MSRARHSLVLIAAAVHLIGVLLAYTVDTAFGADGVEVKAMKGKQSEAFEREVDQAALQAQVQSIAKLKGLLHKYRGTRQEPILLAKLGDLHQQLASIRFRVAHGAANLSKRPLDLTAYKRTLRDSVATLSELISKYPAYEEISQSFYVRGKSYEELGDKALATTDYLHLVNKYPDAAETIGAYMSLAEFSIQDNDHAKATTYLKEVEKNPESAHFPFALYKLAWAQYNLKNIPSALSYAERHVAYYDAVLKETQAAGSADTIVSSDLAFRENMLLDTTTFYIEGVEKKFEQYRSADALKYFRKLDQGPALGKMLARYAKLLRSHSHGEDLERWKDQILKQESGRPESLDVLVITYEHQLNQRDYAKLSETAKDFVLLYKKHPSYEGFKSAQKVLLDTAEGLQQILVKNKGREGLKELTATLASIYDSFTRVVEDTDPRIPGVHYNLAETLFEIQDYEGATQHYRWVVEHGDWKINAKAKSSIADASLKAISSRYQVLKSKKMIVEDLKPRAITHESERPLDPLLAEWITWIDIHVSRTKTSIDDFYFESNRAYYLAGHIKTALKRMTRFSHDHPESKYAIPAASLTLDTYIETKDWENTFNTANDFLEVKVWKNHEFAKKLNAVAADAAYKMAEERYKNKDYAGTLKAADKFLAKYSASERLSDILTIAGNSALETNEKPRADKYYSRLIEETPKASGIQAALLARARMAEDRYDFSRAVRDYAHYIRLASIDQTESKKTDDLRRKTLMLAWLSGEMGEFGRLLSAKEICSESLARECDLYEGLIQLTQLEKTMDEKIVAQAFDRARKGPQANKAVWAAVALAGSKKLAFRDRRISLTLLAEGWDDLDPLVKFTLIPRISSSIATTLQHNRAGMKETAPLLANERYITRRVEVIQEMESAVTRVVKNLPWARIRSVAMSEMAALYLDFSKDLASVPPPKGLPADELASYEHTIRKLVIPFEEKGQDMRSKAYEVASESAIDEEAFFAISDPFFNDNPSLASRLKPAKLPTRPASLSIKLLESIDPSGRWSKLRTDDEDRALLVKALWAKALQEKHWARVAFFMQEAQEKALVQAGVMGALKAVSLSAAGARAEGLVELEEAIDDLQAPWSKTVALRALIEHYHASFYRKKAESLLKTLASINPELANELQASISWEGEKTADTPSKADRKIAESAADKG